MLCDILIVVIKSSSMVFTLLHC